MFAIFEFVVFIGVNTRLIKLPIPKEENSCSAFFPSLNCVPVASLLQLQKPIQEHLAYDHG